MYQSKHPIQPRPLHQRASGEDEGEPEPEVDTGKQATNLESVLYCPAMYSTQFRGFINGPGGEEGFASGDRISRSLVEDSGNAMPGRKPNKAVFRMIMSVW